MPAPSWIVISDDLTGSCDAALEFVRGGITAEVLLDPSRSFADCGADVAVCSTESRNVPAPDAVELVRGAVKRRGGLTGSTVLKKIDSTIRGNIGAEVAELLEMSGAKLAVIAPASPRAGRTTVGGYQLVNGAPVSRSAVGADALSPVKSSFIPDLFAETGVRTELRECHPICPCP